MAKRETRPLAVSLPPIPLTISPTSPRYLLSSLSDSSSSTIHFLGAAAAARLLLPLAGCSLGARDDSVVAGFAASNAAKSSSDIPDIGSSAPSDPRPGFDLGNGLGALNISRNPLCV